MITNMLDGSKVVVTSHTPLVLSYETKSQKVVITFYIQRYDKNDIAVDACTAVKIECLCEILQISKGNFYHHTPLKTY